MSDVKLLSATVVMRYSDGTTRTYDIPEGSGVRVLAYNPTPDSELCDWRERQLIWNPIEVVIRITPGESGVALTRTIQEN